MFSKKLPCCTCFAQDGAGGEDAGETSLESAFTCLDVLVTVVVPEAREVESSASLSKVWNSVPRVWYPRARLEARAGAFAPAASHASSSSSRRKVAGAAGAGFALAALCVAEAVRSPGLLALGAAGARGGGGFGDTGMDAVSADWVVDVEVD